MLKIKDDVPLINLIDMGFKCEPFNVFLQYSKPEEPDAHRERYARVYNNVEVSILSDDREIRCRERNGLVSWSPKMYNHCIRDLVQKGYVEDVKN